MVDKYQALLRTIELESHIAAAERLGCGQEEVIRAIAALEDEYNAPLLICRKTGAWLTPEGRRLLPLLRARAAADD